ncbi:hypothetical protein ANSO36C_68450 (plasmid) [Nostoc cf. commune SO-36]|uniref:Tetratricopeptide repeat protein n=1 Tax=Nostoc cf. commune SO-36 TaxID=449208 RepID=A0ABN6QD23_NOSCO|nr:tetratricopeptide repeat protein [Nostoc commune]BDI21043.1 hypothetical protein ANSO36C_68450 [Nostoc cf. commune SO-36]
MVASRFERAIELYALTLQALEDPEADLPKEAVIKQNLAVLKARDEVQAALAQNKQVIIEELFKIGELDQRLKKHSGTIAQILVGTNYRTIVNPSADAWWWLFQPPLHRWDRFDWLWGFFSAAFLTFTIALLTNVASRFLSGGPDTFGAFTVIGNSVLALLAGQGAFTKGGQSYVKRVLERIGIPKHLWQEASCTFAFLVFIAVLSLHSSLPRIAELYYKWGVKDYEAGRLASAQNNFERSLKLNPDNSQAHFGLGVISEDLLQLETARTEYQIAIKGNLPQAYSNLGRLYILDEKYAAAVSVLLRGSQLQMEDAVRYRLQKNLGWARLKQKRYRESASELEEALNLTKDPIEQAPARCLLAQVLEGQGSKKSARQQWQTCLQNATPQTQEEDQWIDLARQRSK